MTAQTTALANAANVLTTEDVKRAVPSTHRTAVTQSLVDKLNSLSADPLAGEHIRDNFASYSGILKEGKFKIEDYLNAVSYVSHKLMGMTNEDAWAKTFPQRHARLVANGVAKKDIAAHVSAYNKGKLVNMIYEQTMIPVWVLNQDAVQKAINTQVKIMEDIDVNAMARTAAANSILTHLKQPEVIKGKLDININESNEMKSMKAMIEELAQRQHDEIEQGRMKTIDVAAATLVRKEYEEAEITDE